MQILIGLIYALIGAELLYKTLKTRSHDKAFRKLYKAVNGR